jgi:hypothetical protein
MREKCKCEYEAGGRGAIPWARAVRGDGPSTRGGRRRDARRLGGLGVEGWPGSRMPATLAARTATGRAQGRGSFPAVLRVPGVPWPPRPPRPPGRPSPRLCETKPRKSEGIRVSTRSLAPSQPSRRRRREASLNSADARASNSPYRATISPDSLSRASVFIFYCFETPVLVEKTSPVAAGDDPSGGGRPGAAVQQRIIEVTFAYSLASPTISGRRTCQSRELWHFSYAKYTVAATGEAPRQWPSYLCPSLK